MTTGMMLPMAENMDRAGFEAMEIVSGSNFKKCIRELKEDPWERLRLVSQKVTKTPLRLIAGRINTFGFDPKSMYRLFLEQSLANGVREARISDPWNDFDGWERRVKLAREIGFDPIVNLIFSVSPRHTDEYYAERTRQAATLPVYRLCLKDPGGLLTPERVRTLAPLVLKNAGGIHVELHTHCTTGLGPLCCLEGLKAGITTINTAVPPLSDGSSLPSVFNVAQNARALGYTPLVDEDVLRPVSAHFTAIAKREGLPIGAPVEYNYSQYLHQVPGGMISNLAHQLELVGLGDRLDEALEETARVRAELAYPIMVTPLSQFVGSQAAINIVVGERYKEVTDQTIGYAMGRYGEEGAAEMDADIKARILDRPRARELAAQGLPDPSLREMRRKFGGSGVSDEDLLLRWITSKDDVDAMRAAGPPREYLTADQPIVSLIRELSRRGDTNRIDLRRPGFSLTMAKRP
jgi:oxaloacetate decarboxylase alpha subunit